MARLAVRGVGKAYAVPVLTGVDLDLVAGQVHALMGANGAGKSTLTRILCGLTHPEHGTMTLDGQPYAPTSRREAEDAGVQLVLQELNLIDTLSVAENLCLSRLPRRFGLVDRDALLASAMQALKGVGLDALDPRTPVHALGIGQRQLIEVAAAIARPCRVLVLDEPTAALTAPEIDRLFAHIDRLRTKGVAILYISHRTEEVHRIADRVTVLRDGRVVDTREASRADHDLLVSLMTAAPNAEGAASNAEEASGGHARAAQPGSPMPTRAVALRVEGLTRGDVVRDVSFEVHRGEILGLSGLVGSGRTETLRAIVGADAPESGRVTRGDGVPLRIRSPRDAVRAGIGMVPEDRKAQALLLSQSVRTNTSLAVLPSMSRARTWIETERERARVAQMTAALAVRCTSIEQVASELSGGNQQKVVMARWLLRECDVLLLDEPTRGIDVGAKRAIHDLLTDLAAHDTALVVVSSELDELMAICDRIVVLSAGRVTGTFVREAWSEAELMTAAFAGYATTIAPPGTRAGRMQ